MSALGTRTIVWAGGEHQFCLSKVGLIFDLEAKCKAGLSVVRARLEQDVWGISDIRETIRLGLIGGGMSPDAAMELIKHHVDENSAGYAHFVLVALTILNDVVFGIPEDDPVGKTQPAEARVPGSSTTTDASDAPKSSPSPRSSNGRREKSKTTPSGK